METYLALKRAKEMVLQFLAHNRSSLILKTTTNASNWCWSLSFSSCRCFLWRRRRRWWRYDVPAEWMFFPLCFLALSLFSCGQLLRLIAMEENVAPLEEKKLETETKGWRRWWGRAGWSLFVFFCLSSFLLLVPVVFFFARLFSGFLSRASRLVSTEKKWLLLLWGSVEAGLGLRWQRGLLQVQGKKWPREGNGQEGGWFWVLSLSLSFLSEGNGNEWVVRKSEMRKSGRWF